MLVWLNGTFGVGKTRTARLIADRDERWRIFDPEWVGHMLRANLDDQPPGWDFQDLPAWRRLVPVVAAEILEHTGQDLIAVQAVLSSDYWNELEHGFRQQGLNLFHVLLDAAPGTLRQRIDVADDVAARQWRLDHIEPYMTARSDLIHAADLVVDTTAVTPDAVAEAILAAITAAR